MTFEPLHISPIRPIGEVICLMCFWFHKKPKAVQTVKLTFLSSRRASPLLRKSIYRSLIHRKDQTARISLQKPTMSKSAETKSNRRRRVLIRRRPPDPSLFVVRRRLSAAGEGVFTDAARPPQVLFLRKMTIFLQPLNPPQNMGFQRYQTTRGVLRAGDKSAKKGSALESTPLLRESKRGIEESRDPWIVHWPGL